MVHWNCSSYTGPHSIRRKWIGRTYQNNHTITGNRIWNLSRIIQNLPSQKVFFQFPARISVYFNVMRLHYRLNFPHCGKHERDSRDDLTFAEFEYWTIGIWNSNRCAHIAHFLATDYVFRDTMGMGFIDDSIRLNEWSSKLIWFMIFPKLLNFRSATGNKTTNYF